MPACIQSIPDRAFVAPAPFYVSRLYWSAAHNYVGHFGKPPGTTPTLSAERLELVAGKGIVGDRYFDRPDGHMGQVTFFDEEVWERLRDELGCPDRGPEVFRRNVLVRNADLLSLIGREFEVQGVRFVGSEHCKPCFWMDEAFAPGAFSALSSWQAGGLRACVLSNGYLSAA